MLNKVLRTPVDDLVDIVEEKKKCKISYLVSKLNIPAEILERWLIILEEFNVLKLKYVGFEGYVELNKKTVVKKDKDDYLDINKLKSDFIKKSHLKNLDSKKINELWKLFIKKYEAELKEDFYKKARDRNYSPKQIERAWNMYRKDLEVL